MHFNVVLVLFCIVLVLSLGLGAMVLDYWASDAAGRGLTRAYSALTCIAIWILLSLLMLLCGARWSMASFLFAAAAQWLALNRLASMNQQDTGESWLRAVVICSPLLVLAFCAALTWRPSAQTAPGIALILLCLAPLLVRPPNRPIPVEPAKVLPAQALLEEYLTFTEGPGMFTTDLPEQARARIRAMPDRQQKLEALLAAGSDTVLVQVNCFDLNVSQTLCSAARHSLERVAARWRKGEWEPSPDRLIDPSEFLRRHDCPCQTELRALREAVAAYPDEFQRDQFLQRVDVLLK